MFVSTLNLESEKLSTLMIGILMYFYLKVMYFLLGVLDKEKRTTDFRDCYPILDKKAESQFRQKAYTWYTGRT